MHTITLLLVVSICMVGVYSRHLEDVNDPDLLSLDQNDSGKKHSADQSRHRRRRWQMNYGYDYPIPPTHSYYPERRNYDRNQQDLLPQIVKLLEEISAYVRRPPPPPAPQPIYIPYPVPYPVQQYSSCSEKENATKKPTIHSRWPEMEDTNQNWGFVINKDDDDDPTDYSRPISFDPIKPKQPLKRPPPQVEHGSTQTDSQQQPLTTQAPPFNQPGVLRTPNMCNAAILSCCADDRAQQRVCFNGFGCGVSYDNGKACSEDSISAALDSFKSAYSPVQ